MIFRNHSNMLICCSRNISDYYQCSKQLSCFIFLWKPWYILFFRILWWIEISKEQHLFVINVFTVTFDQFNLSLMNKSIHVFFFFLMTLSFWMVMYENSALNTGINDILHIELIFYIVTIFHNITVFTVFLIS